MNDPADSNMEKPGGAIDLGAFRAIVDATPAPITACKQDLEALYAYVGLPDTGVRTRDAIAKALSERIRTSFSIGHQAAWRLFRSLQTDLIREHVMRGATLDPYFEILGHLRDAMRSDDRGSVIAGDWTAAVAAARDHVEFHALGDLHSGIGFAREYAVARAAKALEEAGYAIDLAPGQIILTEAGEKKLVEALEAAIAKMGGLNVARRIFAAIAPAYDAEQGRYHLVPTISSIGGGDPQVPWGYLLQLAVKHLEGEKPHDDSERHWRFVCSLATAFAAVIDVQPYTPMAWGTFDAGGLLLFLRDLALYDTLFRLPQLRSSDVVRLIRGVLDFFDPTLPTRGGWTMDQALAVIAAILDPTGDVRGPVILCERDIRRALPDLAPTIVHTLLNDVFCHPAGANQLFSRPTDVPTDQDRSLGITFGERPLLKLGSRYCLIDRSVCGPALLEALLSALRPEIHELDKNIGPALERYIESELNVHGVPTKSGDYESDSGNGECDVIAETPDTLVFFEVKKKPLTRRARAGMDAYLLLDLAGSLLDAHAQAGWHDVRLRHAGALNLERDGDSTVLKLDGRGIERVALSMLDFGSFQDRIVLKHFLEATMNAAFQPHDVTLAKRFAQINGSLSEIRNQIALRYPGQAQVRQPFFECWFISVPQLLVILDGVTDAAQFRQALWTCRHITTGAADLYYELSRMRRAQAAAPNPI